MGRLSLHGILAMLDGRRAQGSRRSRGKIVLVDILLHRPVQSHRQHLYAATDTEDGDLTVGSKTGEKQLREVTSRVDVVQTCRWFLAHPERVDVGTTREQQSVDMVEHTDYHVAVGSRRDEEWCSAGTYHLLIVGFGQHLVGVVIVGRESYDGLLVPFGKLRIESVQM